MPLDGAAFDFRNPDYDAVFRERIARLERLRRNPSLIPPLREFYFANPAQFISDFGTTFDPRNAERGLPTLVPFILFERQRQWIDYVLRHWHAQKPGITEKSRDSGLSWLEMALACTLCLFSRDPLTIGFGSYKQEYVDDIGNPKSLFWKGRSFLSNLPVEFRGGWTLDRHAPKMRLIFPGNGSVISGDVGDNIGRGDRAALYLLDEAQPLSAKVLTPEGWQTIAETIPGDWAIGRNGEPTRVTHVNECGVHDVFRMTFSDGTSTECSPNHLWTVEKFWGSREQVRLRTHEIASNYCYDSPGGQRQYRYRVPVCEPIRFTPHGPLPLDPYLVGALLGDGSLGRGTVRITTADPEIIDSFVRLLPDGVVVGAFDGRYSYNIVDSRGRQGRLKDGAYGRSRARQLIVQCGIRLSSPDKYIPDIFKFAEPSDRLSLLQGLLDTDGSATRGLIGFFTTSSRLADDVRFLVQSLGGTANYDVKPDPRGYRTIYALQLMLPAGMAPFRLRRKLEKVTPRKHPARRTITAVEHVGRRPVKCITVEATDGLYLTDHCIVTHNSAHLSHPLLVEASLSQTTNCRIDISTPNGLGNPFEQKVHSGKFEVFTFHWRDDPRKDEAWYQKQLAELDPITVAQEIDIDYAASVEGVIIPRAWVLAAVDAHLKLGIEATGVRTATLDIADGQTLGADANAFAVGHGVVIEFLEQWAPIGNDIFGTIERAFRLCDEHHLQGFRYDADGLGAGARGDARVINERRRANGQRTLEVEPFRGSEGPLDPEREDERGRKNRDFFANRKAQGWWGLRRRFRNTHRWIVEGVPSDPDDIISIASTIPTQTRMQLANELAQPTQTFNSVGKMLVDKAPDGAKSPNYGDAVMMLFSRGKSRVVVSDAALAAMRARGVRQRS